MPPPATPPYPQPYLRAPSLQRDETGPDEKVCLEFQGLGAWGRCMVRQIGRKGFVNAYGVIRAAYSAYRF